MRLKGAFPGGVHPHETGNGKKVTGSLPVTAARAPETVAILLSQHVGAPCKPLVKAGQRVLMGQKIGEPSGFVGAPVHASVSGKVKGIQPRVSASGAQVQAVIIENDHLDEWDPSIVPPENADSLDAKALLSLIREAGIVGLGGAAFPTQVKLSPPEGKVIDTLLLNGAECEPYLTSDHRTMLENGAAIIDGMAIARKILGAKKAVIGIEDNKPDAIDATRKAAGKTDIEVRSLPTKYPQGGEKQLIQAITGRQVPSGGLPMDAGCVVLNVSTAAAISDAIRNGRPIIERTVTVTGAVKKPQNLRARVGASIGELIEQCGGMQDGVNKIVLGGPMMGLSAYSLDTPVVKGTSGVLLIVETASANEQSSNCIRCATCVDSCPVGLMPLTLHRESVRGLFDEAKMDHAMDCIECGTCSYVCPAKLPLVQSIRVAKREITNRSRKQA